MNLKLIFLYLISSAHGFGLLCRLFGGGSNKKPEPVAPSAPTPAPQQPTQRRKSIWERMGFGTPQPPQPQPSQPVQEEKKPEKKGFFSRLGGWFARKPEPAPKEVEMEDLANLPQVPKQNNNHGGHGNNQGHNGNQGGQGGSAQTVQARNPLFYRDNTIFNPYANLNMPQQPMPQSSQQQQPMRLVQQPMQQPQAMAHGNSIAMRPRVVPQISHFRTPAMAQPVLVQEPILMAPPTHLRQAVTPWTHYRAPAQMVASSATQATHPIFMQSHSMRQQQYQQLYPQMHQQQQLYPQMHQQQQLYPQMHQQQQPYPQMHQQQMYPYASSFAMPQIYQPPQSRMGMPEPSAPPMEKTDKVMQDAAQPLQAPMPIQPLPVQPLSVQPIQPLPVQPVQPQAVQPAQIQPTPQAERMEVDAKPKEMVRKDRTAVKKKATKEVSERGKANRVANKQEAIKKKRADDVRSRRQAMEVEPPQVVSQVHVAAQPQVASQTQAVSKSQAQPAAKVVVIQPQTTPTGLSVADQNFINYLKGQPVPKGSTRAAQASHELNLINLHFGNNQSDAYYAALEALKEKHYQLEMIEKQNNQADEMLKNAPKVPSSSRTKNTKRRVESKTSQRTPKKTTHKVSKKARLSSTGPTAVAVFG